MYYRVIGSYMIRMYASRNGCRNGAVYALGRGVAWFLKKYRHISRSPQRQFVVVFYFSSFMLKFSLEYKEAAIEVGASAEVRYLYERYDSGGGRVSGTKCMEVRRYV